MALTKADIIEAIQQEMGYSRSKSIEILETMLEIIKNSLAQDDAVLISGFGKFCVKEKSQRKGRNPDTGAEIVLPARKVVTFRCAGGLREKINGYST